MMRALLTFPLNWFHLFFLIKGQKAFKGSGNRELPGYRVTAQAALHALLCESQGGAAGPEAPRAGGSRQPSSFPPHPARAAGLGTDPDPGRGSTSLRCAPPHLAAPVPARPRPPASRGQRPRAGAGQVPQAALPGTRAPSGGSAALQTLFHELVTIPDL